MTKNWNKIDGPVSVDVGNFYRDYREGFKVIPTSRKKFDNLDEALRFNYRRSYSFPTNILYDEQNVAIPLVVLNNHYNKLKHEYDKAKPVRKFIWQYGYKPSYEFRVGAIPFLGKGWACRTKSYRRPKTTNERRANAEKEVEKEVKEEYGINLKQKKRYLRNSWDDIYRHSTKSWKKQRKTQYKETR